MARKHEHSKAEHCVSTTMFQEYISAARLGGLKPGAAANLLYTFFLLFFFFYTAIPLPPPFFFCISTVKTIWRRC